MRSHDRPKFDPRAQLLQRSMTWKLSIIVRNSHIQNCFNSNGPYKYRNHGILVAMVEGKITLILRKSHPSGQTNYKYPKPQRNFRGSFGGKFSKQRSPQHWGSSQPAGGRFPSKNPTGPWYFHLTQKPRAEDPSDTTLPDGTNGTRWGVWWEERETGCISMGPGHDFGCSKIYAKKKNKNKNNNNNNKKKKKKKRREPSKLYRFSQFEILLQAEFQFQPKKKIN